MNTVDSIREIKRILAALNRRLTGARGSISTVNFLVLLDTPANYVGDAAKFVQVNGVPDALQFALITAEDVQAGTFPVGEYIFQSVVTGIDPTLPTHLATKEYVDLAINVQMDYFFNDTLHAIGGIYYNMLDTETGEAESTFTIGPLGGGDDQALVNFATISGQPGVHSLPAGLFSCHIHAQRTIGNRSTQLYFELYKRTDPGGVETLLATSEVSGLVTIKADFNLHAAIGTAAELDPTDILVVKWYANLGGGAPTTIALYAEGENDSHLTIPVLSSIFNAIFVRQDGTTELTADWDVGAFDVTVQNIIAATAKLSNLTDDYLPYHISDALGLANSPMRTDGTNLGAGLLPTGRNNTHLETLDGLGFPAIQVASNDANTQDDYEEGSWTPGVAFGGGVTGITYTRQNGYYTKIGNIVICTGNVLLSDKGSDNGNMTLTGLPFTINNNLAASSPLQLMIQNISFADFPEAQAVRNTTTASMWESTNAGVLTAITDVNFANNSEMDIMCAYRVA